MRVRRSEHTANFTVMPNAILRSKSLGLTARGLLGHLLSLPDGAKATIESIAAEVEEGRRAVSKAMGQLVDAGYVVRRREQDREAGTWSTELFVYDVPATEGPAGRFPTVGEPKGQPVGDSPEGGKYPEKETLPVAEDLPACQEGRGDASQQQDSTEGASQQDDRPEVGRAAALLGRLGAYEAKLSLSAVECLSLAPLAAEWLSRGASELEIRHALADGLPPHVLSARKLVENRLQRKMPAVRVPAEAVALAECAECFNPLPRGQKTGICGSCSGVAAPAATPARKAAVSDEAASLLDQIRERRAAGTVKGSRRRFAPAV